ncbi:hypothetical protein F5Y19DRAFT_475447 [Xylariaceae sp. FL1651]|nr:hypothetical protein F5Y19DRAFT_475447 [Xylariaceae sp. FL1651]
MASRKTKDSKATEAEVDHAAAYPIQPCRSDGTPIEGEDRYTKVEEGEKTMTEWLNKLGQALASELKPGSKEQYFLQDFPAHYHLRYYQARDGRGPKHYYLFGYPAMPGVNARKYFRSPNAFLPHLIWLIGESQDRDDCACEFCAGSKSVISKASRKQLAAPTTTNAAIASGPVPTSTSPGPSIASQQPLHEPQAPIAHPVPQAPPFPQPHSYAVPLDHNDLFRAGEVVWYKNNNSWRVGMIATINPALSIIPFGHPLYQTQEVNKEEADLRPFLAFSIPQINNALQEFKGRALAQIDWHALQERFGTNTDPSRQEGLAIEATKLAATRVDQCYSTFNLTQEPVQGYDVFGGIFLGAEKICVGEAVRIKLSREQQDQGLEPGMPVVMVLKRILVSKDVSQTLMFEGNIWKLQHTALAQQPQAPGYTRLPQAMLGEKEFRDGILQSRGWRVEWVLNDQIISVNETAIRGRFYETRRLTPILNPAKYEEMLRQQNVGDIQTLLNNRGDSSGPRVGRVLNRAQAVAGAVPVGVPASLGPDVIEA